MARKKKEVQKKGGARRTPVKKKDDPLEGVVKSPRSPVVGSISGVDKPEVVVEALFTEEQCLEAIEDLAGKRKAIRDDMKVNKDMVKGLELRQAYYRRELKQGRFNKEAMERSISDMNVEIRRYQDKNQHLFETKEHYSGVIKLLQAKIEELHRIFGDKE